MIIYGGRGWCLFGRMNCNPAPPPYRGTSLWTMKRRGRSSSFNTEDVSEPSADETLPPDLRFARPSWRRVSTTACAAQATGTPHLGAALGVPPFPRLRWVAPGDDPPGGPGSREGLSTSDGGWGRTRNRTLLAGGRPSDANLIVLQTSTP